VKNELACERVASFEAGDMINAFFGGERGKPRIIFIHGTPGNALIMARYLLDPIPGHECIAIDRPGFGTYAKSTSVETFEQQAKLIAGLLEERDGRWPIIVGHSLGGPIAARVAADYPDRVGGLVILAGSLDPGLEESRWYNWVSSLEPSNTKMPTAYQHSNQEIAMAPRETSELAKVLHRITCPVRVIHGDADTLVPVANVDFAASAIRNSRSFKSIVIKGEGHGIHTSQEAIVRREIEQLADELSGTR
jgi:pimeloyl-ACP methyl ester carboxylesterase